MKTFASPFYVILRYCVVDTLSLSTQNLRFVPIDGIVFKIWKINQIESRGLDTTLRTSKQAHVIYIFRKCLTSTVVIHLYATYKRKSNKSICSPK